MPSGVIKDSHSSPDGFSVCALEALANIKMLVRATQILAERVIIDLPVLQIFILSPMNLSLDSECMSERSIADVLLENSDSENPLFQELAKLVHNIHYVHLGGFSATYFTRPSCTAIARASEAVASHDSQQESSKLRSCHGSQQKLLAPPVFSSDGNN